MNRFVRVLPFAVVALLLMPGALRTPELNAATGGSPDPLPCNCGRLDPLSKCNKAAPGYVCESTRIECVVSTTNNTLLYDFQYGDQRCDSDANCETMRNDQAADPSTCTPGPLVSVSEAP